ncbi:MAG TPA: polymorphic toxin-type HINT domain-containing protein, partial [Pirellulales bacterium]
IPALEHAIAADSAKSAAGPNAMSRFQQEGIAITGRMSEQRATYSLVMESVLGKVAELRAAAAKELKRRPLHDFVPVLLAGLSNPIQFDYSMSFDPSIGLAIYRAVGWQEGRDRVTRVEYSSSAAGLLPSFVGSFDSGIDPTSRLAPRKTPVVGKTSPYDANMQTITAGPQNVNEVAGAAAMARQSEKVAGSVAKQNERIVLLDQRIDYVLEQVTGMKSDAAERAGKASAGESNAASADETAVIPETTPAKPASSTSDAWWNWWADYTETYQPQKPLDSTTYDSGTYANRSQLLSVYGGGSSRLSSASAECFAAGTPVATLTGPMVIEKLSIGDRVLAQNPDTGELGYKTVTAMTVRPPTETVLVRTTRGEIRASRGHPFWIVGKGWRMAKELEVGDRLHCLEGSARVAAIDAQPTEKVYNLTVADFGTYFVGQGQVLVHDNTPRLPTRAALPGYVASK